MQYLHSFPLQIYFQLPSFVEDGERNEKHYQESRNIVLHKYGVSVLNIWQLQAGTDQTERHKPIRRWKTNSCAAANFKIETLQGPAKTINRSELSPHFFFFVFFLVIQTVLYIGCFVICAFEIQHVFPNHLSSLSCTTHNLTLHLTLKSYKRMKCHLN